MVCIHNGVSLSNRNNDRWFEGKWMQLEDTMLSEVSQAQKNRSHIFSHKCKIDPKDNHIHKNKYDHIETHTEHICNSRSTL
jgi:hypothetical protein